LIPLDFLYSILPQADNNSVLVLIDEVDRVVVEKRLRNDLALMLAELAPYRKKLAGLVVESTYNWYCLVDGFMEAVTTGPYVVCACAALRMLSAAIESETRNGLFMPRPPCVLKIKYCVEQQTTGVVGEPIFLRPQVGAPLRST